MCGGDTRPRGVVAAAGSHALCFCSLASASTVPLVRHHAVQRNRKLLMGVCVLLAHKFTSSADHDEHKVNILAELERTLVRHAATRWLVVVFVGRAAATVCCASDTCCWSCPTVAVVWPAL